MKSESEEKVLPKVPFNACIEEYGMSTTVSDWLSPVTNERGNAIKSNRLQTFPKYLFVELSRYYVNDKWVPEKHDVEIPVPEQINIQNLRGKGKQENEEEMPKSNANSNNNSNANIQQIEPSVDIVSTLMGMGMGFSENACKKAAIAVQNANSEIAGM